ncbi:MAG TPA: hypothetical protein VFH31_04570 [Pyrinomonadaceae bacterium]|nr:hypothetical protein [Pyrinomonadaceae bacterium]
MKRELGLLNAICIIVAVLFIGFAVLNALFLSNQFFTTDNLFVTMVCMMMALMFIANPLLYLKSEGRLPIPFVKRLRRTETAQLAGVSPPLLDARGRAVPPDVSAMLARMKKTPSGDA